jgi:hypothetical protein
MYGHANFDLLRRPRSKDHCSIELICKALGRQNMQVVDTSEAGPGEAFGYYRDIMSWALVKWRSTTGSRPFTGRRVPAADGVSALVRDVLTRLGDSIPVTA